MMALRHVALLWLALGVAACARSIDPASRPSPRPTAVIQGVLRAEDGALLGHAQVMACTGSACLLTATATNGSFTFQVDAPGRFVVKTPEELAEPRRAAVMRPLVIERQGLLDLGDVYVPSLPRGASFSAALDRQTVEVGDDLALTLRRADLVPKLGSVIDDLRARRIPSAHWKALPEVPSERILAVYALHPFGVHSRAPIAARAAADLPAGTSVVFRTISETDGTLGTPVPGVADGSFVSTAPDTGIDELTWLVISH